MKALTLHQPYATAIALGIKTVETRSWATSHRGRVAIHAGVHHLPTNTQLGPNAWTGRLHDSAVGLWRIDPDRAVADDPLWTPLPLGQVIAVATITDCLHIEAEHPKGGLAMWDDYLAADEDQPGNVRRWQHGTIQASVTVHVGTGTSVGDGGEGWWGDYRPGRWAWLLTDVEPLDEPVPCRGYQRLWNVELPEPARG